jgi:hypothetical protein
MEAPDVVDAKLREVVRQVDVEVDPDVHVGYDMPMSIYSQYKFHHFLVSKLLRSKFLFRSVFKLVKRLKGLNLDVKSLYFIQSAYTIYLCMSIYLFYLL